MNLHVVGRGACCSLGVDLASFLDGIFAGRSGVRPLRRLADTDCLTEVCGEVDLPFTATELPFAIGARVAQQALADFGGPVDDNSLLVVASTKADLSGVVTREGHGLGSPRRLAARLATDLDWQGPVAAVSCACASGLSALALAGRELRAGAVTRALVVGTDAITPFVLRGFSSLFALAPGQSRPFDRDRDGLNLGEGAGAIVLSTHASEARGVELLSWGESNDANHITGPSRDGAGLALAIERALRIADLAPADVDYVHLHGTGTPFNDAMETKALEHVFGNAPVASGSKAQLGHTLGAAGLLESLVAIAALERGTAPGNLGLENLDDDCPVDLPRATTPLARTRTALKLAAGFGGINAALLFGRSAS